MLRTMRMRCAICKGYGFSFERLFVGTCTCTPTKEALNKITTAATHSNCRLKTFNLTLPPNPARSVCADECTAVTLEFVHLGHSEDVQANCEHQEEDADEFARGVEHMCPEASTEAGTFTTLRLEILPADLGQRGVAGGVCEELADVREEENVIFFLAFVRADSKKTPVTVLVSIMTDKATYSRKSRSENRHALEMTRCTPLLHSPPPQAAIVLGQTLLLFWCANAVNPLV